jgi:hypothetical protein
VAPRAEMFVPFLLETSRVCHRRRRNKRPALIKIWPTKQRLCPFSRFAK